jgi:hypothetical protein
LSDFSRYGAVAAWPFLSSVVVLSQNEDGVREEDEEEV